MSEMLGVAAEHGDAGNRLTGSQNGETDSAAAEEANATAVDSHVGIGSGTSGFSFLIGTPSAPPPPPADATPASSMAPAPSWGGLATTSAVEQSEASTASAAADANAAPPPAPANADFLSMSNPGLPTGAGVSWSAPPIGAAPTKKVIKKRLGKTRVGVAAAATATPAPGPAEIPAPSPAADNNNHATSHSNANAYIPAPVPEQPYQTSQVPSTPQHHTAPPPPMSPTSPPLRVKAEKAMQSADEFIREKQRSAIAMAAERAMHERSGIDVRSASGAGDRGSSSGTMTPSSSHPSLQMPSANDLTSDGSSAGWKLGNPAEVAAQFGISPKDETYQAAKAAAEEARKLSESVPASKGKVSLFGAFFGRGKSNGTGGHGDSISSYSSHGGVVTPAKANERQDGNAHSLSPTKEEDSSSYVVAAHLQPRPSPPGHDATSSEERGMQDAYREREMEIERERMRIAMEQQRKREEEAERKRLEFVAMEAERRRKEEEEAERQRKLAEEEAARRRSPREKMQAILDHFADVTRISTDRVTELRERRAKLVKDRTDAEKTERFAAQQISYAETQQIKAAEEEDFEAADRLATVIERHAKEREEQAEIMKQIGYAIAELDREREEASKAVAACFRNVHVKLKELKDEHEHLRDGDGSDVIKQFEKTSKRLSAESERLSNDLKHIERDEELVSEEQKELGGQISEETKEFAEKCNEATDKLEEVNKVIADLRKQLAEAEEKAAKLNAEISKHKESIVTVRSKFSRQLGRLEKKEQSVKEHRADWEAEKQSLNKAKEAHEAAMAAHSEEMLSRDKLIEDITAEVKIARDFEEIISDKLNDSLAIGEEHISTLDSEVLKFEVAVDEANHNLVSAQAIIDDLEEEMTSIDTRIPILEAEKKMAASKRDFKAAGKASKEIKDALARKEQCEAQLAGEAAQRKKAAKDELEKATVLLEEKKCIALQKGQEAGKKQMADLRCKIDELKALLKNFDIDESDDEANVINVSCVGAFVIQSQIDLLDAHGKSLGEKYGGWISEENGDVSVHSAPTFDSADEEKDIVEASAKVIDESTIEEFRTLNGHIQELEHSIEKAVAEEDFDTAAELEEKIQSVRAEIESWGFSLDELSQALSKVSASNTPSPTNKREDAEQKDDTTSTSAYDDLVEREDAEQKDDDCAGTGGVNPTTQSGTDENAAVSADDDCGNDCQVKLGPELDQTSSSTDLADETQTKQADDGDVQHQDE